MPKTKLTLACIMTMLLTNTNAVAAFKATCPNGDHIEIQQPKKVVGEKHVFFAPLNPKEQTEWWVENGTYFAQDGFIEALTNTCKYPAVKLPEGMGGICNKINELNTDTVLNFVKANFEPELVLGEKFNDGGDIPYLGMMTGYISMPVLASKTKDDEFKYPVYLSDAYTKSLTQPRELLEKDTNLKPIVYTKSKFDSFLLQFQGSGFYTTKTGEKGKLFFGNKVSNPGVSPGRLLTQCKEITGKVNNDIIRQWFNDHPDKVDFVLNQYQSYVFFTTGEYNGEEPVGAANIPLVPKFTGAVDTNDFNYGELLFVSTNSYPVNDKLVKFANPVFALDTGGSIIGITDHPGRLDLYLGSKPENIDVANKLAAKDVLFYRLKPKAN